MTGIFIAFEGPDGSGKSTAAKNFIEKLKEMKFDVELTREPGGTRISEKIRELILDNDNKEMTAVTEALLYAGARAQHVEEKIVPLLESGKVVVSDRYVVSSLAYQGHARGLGIDVVNKINKFATSNLSPDITFFFEISPEVALKRKFIDREADRLENEGNNFHNKTYEGYKLAIKNERNVVLIDANKNEEEVVNQCVNEFIKFMSKRK